MKILSHIFCRNILIIIGLVLSNSTIAQTFLIKTSIESGFHNYTFSETVIDTNAITVFVDCTFQIGGPYEFRVYDHQYNLIKRKQFFVNNDSLVQLCGNGYTWMHRFPMKVYPHLADSSIYVTTNFTHNYGTCQQLNGLALIKFNNEFDVVWLRHFSTISKGSIPFNDSTLLIYGSNFLFNVDLSGGDTLWVKRSSSPIEGAFNGFNDSTVFMYGRKSVPGYGYGGNIRELSDNGNVNWDITVHDSTTSQYFINGIKTSDSCFAMLSIRNPNTSSQGLALIKINRQGSKLWEQVYSLPGYSTLPADLFQSSDGGFLITFKAHSTSGLIDKNVLLKIDSLGMPEWNKNFAGTIHGCQAESIYKIMNLNDEKLLITGSNLIETDSLGNSCFFTLFNILNVSNGASVVVSSFPTALTSVNPPNSINYNISSNNFIEVISSEISYTDSCFVLTNLSDQFIETPVKIFPNPGTTNIKIQFSECKNEPRLRIYNLLGSEVYNTIISNGEVIISFNEIGTGLFTAVVECDDQLYYSKIIFTH